MNRWKVAFFVLLLTTIAGAVWAGGRLFDQALTLSFVQTTVTSQREENDFKTTLLDKAYAGTSKREFVEAVLKARPSATIKDDPPILWVDSTAYEFDANEKFVRQVRPQ